MVVSPTANTAEAQTEQLEDQSQTLGSRQMETIDRDVQEIPDLGFGFADAFGPLIAGSIVIAALLYSRNVLEVNRRVADIRK